MVNGAGLLYPDPNHSLQYRVDCIETPRGQSELEFFQPASTYSGHDETNQGRNSSGGRAQPIGTIATAQLQQQPGLTTDGTDRLAGTGFNMGDGQPARSRSTSPGAPSGKATSPRPNESLAKFKYHTQSSEDAFLDDILKGLSKKDGPDDGSSGNYLGFLDDDNADGFFDFLSGEKAEAPDFDLPASSSSDSKLSGLPMPKQSEPKRREHRNDQHGGPHAASGNGDGRTKNQASARRASEPSQGQSGDAAANVAPSQYRVRSADDDGRQQVRHRTDYVRSPVHFNGPNVGAPAPTGFDHRVSAGHAKTCLASYVPVSRPVATVAPQPVSTTMATSNLSSVQEPTKQARYGFSHANKTHPVKDDTIYRVIPQTTSSTAIAGHPVIYQAPLHTACHYPSGAQTPPNTQTPKHHLSQISPGGLSPMSHSSVEYVNTPQPVQVCQVVRSTCGKTFYLVPDNA